MIPLRDFAYAKFRLRASHFAQNDDDGVQSNGSRGGSDSFFLWLSNNSIEIQIPRIVYHEMLLHAITCFSQRDATLG